MPMPKALVAHAWQVTARGREQRRCCFRVDTGDRVKGATPATYVPRPALSTFGTLHRCGGRRP